MRLMVVVEQSVHGPFHRTTPIGAMLKLGVESVGKVGA